MEWWRAEAWVLRSALSGVVLMLMAFNAHATPSNRSKSNSGLHVGHGGTPPEHFPELPVLKDAIGFWEMVFSEYDSSRAVLHDRDYVGVVWQVVDLPLDLRTGKADERRAQSTMRGAANDLSDRLQRLHTTPLPRDAEDEQLLRRMREVGPTVAAGAWQRIRIQRGVADHFRLGMHTARTWIPHIYQVFTREHLPPQLAAIPFVETMFNPKARSAAGASGLWQLMPRTARDLGLRVTPYRDDRMDVLMATRAAARMLRSNHRMLGNWPLAITAYNHGPGGVKKAVRRVGSMDLGTLIQEYEHGQWGFASKNFYAEFLAALNVLEGHRVLGSYITQRAAARP